MPDPRIWPIGQAYTDHVTVLGVSTLVRAANSHRVSLNLVNDGASVIYLSLGNPAVVGDGMRINPYGGSYHIGQSNLWLGEIYGITDDDQEMCNMTISEGYMP